MFSFQYIRTLLGNPATFDTGITDLEIVQGAGGPVLYSINQTGGGVQSFGLSGSAPVLLGQTFLSSGWGMSSYRLGFLDLGTEVDMFAVGALPSSLSGWILAANGTAGSTVSFTTDTAYSGNIEALISLRSGANTFLFAHHYGSAGITTYQVGAGHSLYQSAQTAAAIDIQTVDSVHMATATVAGNDYLLLANGVANTITSYQVNTSGALTQVGQTGAPEGLGIAAPDAIKTLTMGGTAYAIVAAAGSSSLSVLRVGADGVLTPTDHVIDDLYTRFASVAALETVTIGQRAFVLAGGADNGVSLFTLLPDGHLLNLAQVYDTTATSLANVSALAAQATGTDIQLFATSETEPGISEFSINPGADGAVVIGTAGADTLNGTARADLIDGGAGNDILVGGNGADILIDGAGVDTMTGGSGADIFVFTADGQNDTVTDFNRFQDRLDLSNFALFHSAAQLQITPTSDGAVLAYRAETITLHSYDGSSLSVAQISALALTSQSRVPLSVVSPIITITGTASADILLGTPATETILGNGGSDLLSSGGGGDFLDGGSGSDTVSYAFASAGVVVNLENSGANAGIAAGDTYKSIENVEGSAFNDTLVGNAGANLLDGAGGNDLLRGGAGSDILHGGAGIDTVDYSLATGSQRIDLLYPRLNTNLGVGDSYSSIENLIGGNGADNLRGTMGANRLEGGSNVDWLFGRAGNDTLVGGVGNDVLLGGVGADTLNGGTNRDRAQYSESQTAVTVDLMNPSLNTGEAAGDTYISIEDLAGSKYSDSIRGDMGANRLFGRGGNDALYGRGGNDYLNGGAGLDRLEGGIGNDDMRGGANSDTFVFSFGSNADIVEDFADNVDVLQLNHNLWTGSLTAAQVVADFATVSNGNTVFDFGNGDTLTLWGVTDQSVLVNDIHLF